MIVDYRALIPGTKSERAIGIGIKIEASCDFAIWEELKEIHHALISHKQDQKDLLNLPFIKEDQVEGTSWGNKLRDQVEGPSWGNKLRDQVEGPSWGTKLRDQVEGLS